MDLEKIVLFGDSITQYGFNTEIDGYCAQVADAYARKLDVVGRGFSGYNTKLALKIWSLEYARQIDNKIRLIVIFFGANDQAKPGWLQHVPLDEYELNLIELISRARDKAPKAHIIVMPPPPLDEHKYESEVQRSAVIAMTYAEKARQVADKCNVAFADIWQAIMRYAGWSPEDVLMPGSRSAPPNAKLAKVTVDGLHLSNKGYKILWEVLDETIRREYPDIHYSNIEQPTPSWDDYLCRSKI